MPAGRSTVWSDSCPAPSTPARFLRSTPAAPLPSPRKRPPCWLRPRPIPPPPTAPFDITIAPLVSLWGITTDSPYVPTQQEIDALLPLVGPEHLHLSGDTATLDDGCAIDLGGIAKGYASDRVAAIFARHGITSGTISLGGNVYVCGSKPNGQPWVVAIQDPRSDGYAVTVALTDSFAVTSGGYQRYYTAPDGTVYQHILDPKTGYPVESDLLSVSILCDNGTMADAYSTALYVMGSAPGRRPSGAPTAVSR